jgi:predicted amino acid racemase
MGATHVEPGNALHGTTPLHIYEPDAEEQPGVAFVTEVSHIDGGDAYVFAGGYYADKVLGEYQLTAAVGRGPEALERVLPVDVVPDGAISYYAIVRGARAAGARVGDSVVCCFRPQAFVTRGRTQAVSGLHGGAGPQFGPRYDQEARVVEGVG